MPNKKLKVLHLTTHFNTGGISSYILGLVKPLKNIGVEFCVASSLGDLSGKLKESGANFFPLNIQTKTELNPKLLFALFQLIPLIRNEKIDLIHAHTRITQVLGRVASLLTSVPLITTCHGFYKRRLGRKLFPCWGKKVIAISDAVKKHLEEDFKVPSAKIQMIHNSIDLESFDREYRSHKPVNVRNKYGFKSEDFVICVIARLIKEKGQIFLIEAMRHLVSTFPNLKLLIVGSGRDEKKLKDEVLRFGLLRHVIFAGKEQNVTIPLAACDLFVHPAIWREAFGISIIEAMAASKPVISTSSWALYDRVKDVGVGLYVKPGDSLELQDAIKNILQDPERAKRLGQAGRVLVECGFSTKQLAYDFFKLYKENL